LALGPGQRPRPSRPGTGAAPYHEVARQQDLRLLLGPPFQLIDQQLNADAAHAHGLCLERRQRGDHHLADSGRRDDHNQRHIVRDAPVALVNGMQHAGYGALVHRDDRRQIGALVEQGVEGIVAGAQLRTAEAGDWIVAALGHDLLEGCLRAHDRAIARLERRARLVDERDLGVAQLDQVIDGVADGLAEVDVHVIQAVHVGAAPDHAERELDLAQHVDSRVVLVDLHHDDAIDQPLLGELAQLVEIVHVVGPQHQAVLVLFGGVGGAGDEL